MTCRGVHFAITDEQTRALLAAKDDDTVMALVAEIEEEWDKNHLAEVDKAWDAMHRCLTDGQLECGGGTYPLSHCVLGPRQLHEGDEYFVSLVLPQEVRDVVAALDTISEAWFREQYRARVPNDYSPNYGAEDEDYTWPYFEEVRTLFRKAAAGGRAVIFTVDQ